MADLVVKMTDTEVVTTRCSTVAPAEPRELVGHDSFEIVLVRSGTFHYRDRRGSVAVDPTTAVLGAPRQEAEIAHPAGGGDLDTILLLSREAWHSVTGDDQVPLSVPVPPRLFVAQHQLLAARSEADALTLDEATLNLTAALVSQVAPRRIDAGLVRSERARRDLVANTQALLATDQTVSTVREIAAQVGCSPHHLSRIFHAQTGVTLGSYRLHLRVQLAIELLISSDASVSDIAAHAGFADHPHLTRTLGRHTGLTPSRLRAELRHTAMGGGPVSEVASRRAGSRWTPFSGVPWAPFSSYPKPLRQVCPDPVVGSDRRGEGTPHPSFEVEP